MKEYSRQDSLKHHLQTNHPKEHAVRQGRFFCTICEKSFYHATKLVTHCEKDHGIKIGEIHLLLTNMLL